MSCVLDPNTSAVASATNNSSTSIGATISTTNPADIVVAVVSYYTSNTNTAQPPSTANIASTSGLNWGIRSRQTYATSISSHLMTTEIWWAFAPNALVNELVTATLIPSGQTAFNTLDVFAVSGCDPVQPWDSHSSLPASSNIAGSGGSASHTISGIYTNNANPFLIAILATQAATSGNKPADSGWTRISNVNGASFGSVHTEYQAATAAQSNLSQNVWTAYNTVTTNYTAIVDALIPAGTTWTGANYVNEQVTTFLAAASWTATLPGNRISGRVLVGMLSQTATSQTPTWPAGWTVVSTTHGTSQTAQLAWRVIDGSEAATITVTNLGSAGAGIIKIVQFGGNDRVAPIGHTSVNTGHSTASVTDTAITTTRDRSLAYFGIDIGSPYAAPIPNKWTCVKAVSVTSPGLGGFSSMYEEELTSGSTSDSITMTLPNAVDWLAFLVEIKAPALPIPRSVGAIFG